MRCYGVSGGVAGESDSSVAVFNNVVRVAWTLLQLLQARRVPHNALIAYDDATSQPLVIVFPRQQQRENGVDHVTVGEEEEGGRSTTGSLRFAIAEVAGLVVAGTAASYRHMSQEMYARIMRDEVSLSKVRATGHCLRTGCCWLWRAHPPSWLRCVIVRERRQEEAESIVDEWKRLL